MKSGICPKCAGEQIYRSYGKDRLAGGILGNDGPLRTNIYNKDRGFLGEFTLLYFMYYLCRDCGYVEAYVHQLENLNKLDESTNWERVPRAPAE